MRTKLSLVWFHSFSSFVFARPCVSKMADQARILSNQNKGRPRSYLSPSQWERLARMYSAYRMKHPGLSVRAFRSTLLEKKAEMQSFGLPYKLPCERAFQKHLRLTGKTIRERGKVDNAFVDGKETTSYACGHRQESHFAAYLQEKILHYRQEICPTCETAQKAMADKVLHDKAVLVALQQNLGTVICEWPDEFPHVHYIEHNLLVNKLKRMPRELIKCEDFQAFLNGTTKVRHLQLDSESPSKKHRNESEGGCTPNTSTTPTNSCSEILEMVRLVWFLGKMA